VIFAMQAWKRAAEAHAAQRREGFFEAARTGIAFVRGSSELKADLRPRALLLRAGHLDRHPAAGDRPLRARARRVRLRHPLRGVRRRRRCRRHVDAAINRLFGPDRANIWAMGVQPVCNLVAALAMTPHVVGTVRGISGACWITVIANNGASVQMILPNFMRARGMAVHQMVFFGAMVTGSLLWGKDRHLLGTCRPR
jgi:hypothetical protein